MRRTISLAATVTLLAGVAFAHSGATGVVKERMELMGVLDRAMKDLATLVRAPGEGDGERLVELAVTIREHAGAAITAKFPDGSINGPSDALPEIWDDWADFESRADRLHMLADALAEAAVTAETSPTDPLAFPIAGLQRLTEEQAREAPPSVLVAHISANCSACHLEYRDD